jgi:hypothetical protein
MALTSQGLTAKIFVNQLSRLILIPNGCIIKLGWDSLFHILVTTIKFRKHRTFATLVVQKTPEQPTGQEFRPFLQIPQHERSAFERSCPTFSDLKPIVFVEKIRESYISKSCWISDTRVLCTTKHSLLASLSQRFVIKTYQPAL